MAGRNKKTAHAWADQLTSTSGLKAHGKKVCDKYGQGYLDDWIALHREETRWARSLLKHREFTCLDTETTSVDAAAEMTEMGITDGYGATLCQTLIRPVGKLKKTASEITGITAEDLKTAPRLAKVHPQIQAAISAHPLLLIYNAEFDLRIINQSTFQAGLPEFELPKVECLMLHFARWTGDWNPRQDDYAWWRLEGGHRAVGDCRAMISLMECMARLPQTDPSWRPAE